MADNTYLIKNGLEMVARALHEVAKGAFAIAHAIDEHAKPRTGPSFEGTIVVKPADATQKGLQE